MSSASEKVIQLRQLLAERFQATASAERFHFLTGLPVLDEIGVPGGTLTEFVVESGPGGSLLLSALLHAIGRRGERLALVDGKDAFPPKSLPQADLDRLLWIRCRSGWEAIKAADLVLRDGNFSVVILLMSLVPAKEQARIPASAWHRLQMLAEKSSATVLIFSSQAQVGCARLRVVVDGAFPLSRFHASREELLPSLVLRQARRRVGMERRDDEALRRAACA